VRCPRCSADLGGLESRVATLCVSSAGDEVIHSYWRCGACDRTAVESYRDRFMGDADIVAWTLTAAQGDDVVRLVATCPDPDDKRCDCPAHRALASGAPPSP
jgi:hypothetical protein